VTSVRKTPYKTIGDFILNLYIIDPEDRRDEPRPRYRTAILFFFCGGWTAFDASKFYPQSSYFASRGAVCINAEVRVAPIHATTPVECVVDAKSAVRWVRAHAGELGIDQNRIVVAGGSAAGHVSACCGVIDGFDDPQDETPSISSKPNALVLFNPTLDMVSLGRRIERFGGYEVARSLSPLHNIQRGVPPFLVMHGRDDEVVDVDEVIRFKEAMDKVGNRCDLRLYEQQGHGFFNYFDGANFMFTETLREMDNFLTGMGFLDGEERVDTFVYRSRQ
jgi:acetyl esterase